jgi:hypothetical protein
MKAGGSMEKGFNKLDTGIFMEYRLNSEDIENLLRHKKSKILSLRKLKINNLDFLLDLKELEALRVYACTIEDCSALQNLKKLKKLFINGVAKENDNFSFLSEIETIESLDIGYAQHFVSFPNLEKCKNLRRLNIFNCKKLADISNITTIPSLDTFGIVVTPQEPQDLEFIMQMPTLKFMSGAFGSDKKDLLFRELLEKYGLQYG